MASEALPRSERQTPNSISEQEAYEIAKDAYVYAYPLLLADVTLRQQTNFTEPTGKLCQAPLNQFSHATEFTPADWTGTEARISAGER